MDTVLHELYQQQIQSIIVEGGKKTLQRFLDAYLWDEIFILIGEVELETGVEAPKILYHPDNKIDVERESILHYRNSHR